jgi:hypothetical protein
MAGDAQCIPSLIIGQDKKHIGAILSPTHAAKPKGMKECDDQNSLPY